LARTRASPPAMIVPFSSATVPSGVGCEPVAAPAGPVDGPAAARPVFAWLKPRASFAFVLSDFAVEC